MIVEVPDLRLSPGIICVGRVVHVALVYYPWGESREGALMGLHKLLEKLQQKRAKMTVSVAHAKYENHDLSALIFIHKMVDLEMIRDNSFLRKSFHNTFGWRPTLARCLFYHHLNLCYIVTVSLQMVLCKYNVLLPGFQKDNQDSKFKSCKYQTNFQMRTGSK